MPWKKLVLAILLCIFSELLLCQSYSPRTWWHGSQWFEGWGNLSLHESQKILVNREMPRCSAWPRKHCCQPYALAECKASEYVFIIQAGILDGEIFCLPYWVICLLLQKSWSIWFDLTVKLRPLLQFFQMEMLNVWPTDEKVKERSTGGNHHLLLPAFWMTSGV